LQIDKSGSSEIDDIREPKVINSIIEIEKRLNKRTDIKYIQSVGSVFVYSGAEVPDSKEAVIFILDQMPGSERFFNRDYTATIMLVSTEAVNSDEKTREVVTKINEDIASAGTPSDIKITVTGVAPLRSDIMTLLLQDTVFTTIVAALLILIIIFVLEYFAVMPTVQIFWPIVVGVIWTYGLMGWLGIPLNIITATVGAMLIGLDVEYGTFMVRRISEEWNKRKSAEEGIVVAVPAIGRAIIGSGGAMIIGFGVLAVSSLPLIQHLGIVLSLGIFFRLLMSVFINPAVIFYARHVGEKRKAKTHENN
jgi:predicted RND superfamily exporter protein